MTRRELTPLLLFFLVTAGFTWAVQDDPFFWDTIQLASKHAHFFYAQGGAWAALPADIDSGHPPALGYYLAFLWAVFGKTLATGHWGMLPFLWSIIWSLFRLGKRLGGDAWAFWLFPLVLLDPVLLGQMAMVSPDTVLAAFFLCSVDGISGRHKTLTIIGITGLCIVSMRGMMCAGALFIWMFMSDRKAFLHSGWVHFLPGFTAAAVFLIWHFNATGWIGYHASSPWAPAFRQAAPAEMLRNVVILAWRWLDFGRLAEWIAVAGLLWYGKKRMLGTHWGLPPTPKGEYILDKVEIHVSFPIMFSPLGVGGSPQKRPFNWQLFLLLLCLFVLLSISVIRYNNLSAHRYLLPVFIAFHLFVFQWIVKMDTLRSVAKKWIFTALSVSFALGNFQTYPHGISMDWDSTLAHLPYHPVRTQAIQFLQQQHISLSSVGSAFPNLNTGENIALDGSQDSFSAIDTAQNRYVFISNVFNDVSKEDQLELQQKWELIWKQQRGVVWGEIYCKTKTKKYEQ